MSAQASRRHARRTGVRIVLGVLTMLVIIAMFVALLIVRPLPSLVDASAKGEASSEHTVSQLQTESYCPARMSLADTGSYGDSEFQASAGDIASSARYAAFGSVFRSVIGTTASMDGATALQAADAADVSSIMSASGNVDGGSTLLQTRMLESKSGTGAVASMASWATEGDLKGVSAVSCVTPALTHAFVVGGTATGTTQQLVIANPSSKATSLGVRAWGTSGTGALTLSTGETVTVEAYGETTVDLSAAAPNQDGLYVTVSSERTPVAAVIRTVAADGLTSKGSEVMAPAVEPEATAVMPSVRRGDDVRVIAFAERDTTTTLSWVTDKGLVQSAAHDLTGGKVTVIDMGKAPAGALAVASTAQDSIRLTAEVGRSGDDGQADFALVRAERPSAVSALTVPDHMDATITVVNAGTTDADGTLIGYDGSGKRVGDAKLDLSANAARSVDVSDIGDDAVTFRLDVDGGQIVWGARLTNAQVDDAHLAGLASLAPTSLEETTERIWSSQNAAIVR